MTTEIMIVFIVMAIPVIFLSFFFGSKAGAFNSRKLIEQEREKKSATSQFHQDRLQNEVYSLNQQLSKYLNFFVTVPKAIKNINSNLSFDDLISSIIRLIKELINTNQIEIYMFNRKSEILELVAALGTNRGKCVKITPGEGVVGCAAETKMLFSKDLMKLNGKEPDDQIIETATPIILRDELVGVIGIGKFNSSTDNDKRFLAMIADLSAVALKNCTAHDSEEDNAEKDELTKLYNRQFFLERGEETIRQSTNYGYSFSVVILSIDSFEHYNDTNGQAQGDVLLKGLSNLLKKNTRSTSVVARYEGEKFIILLRNADKDDAIIFAVKTRKLIESYPFPEREKQPLGFVSVSGGTATFPLHGKTINELIEHAEEALHESKESAENLITQYKPSESLPEVQPVEN
jgi:diguanylate cyclase (GGDEF)-like protein